jgi:hypothetical protein
VHIYGFEKVLLTLSYEGVESIVCGGREPNKRTDVRHYRIKDWFLFLVVSSHKGILPAHME